MSASILDRGVCNREQERERREEGGEVCVGVCRCVCLCTERERRERGEILTVEEELAPGP